jgi:hypothetical protein
MCPTRFHVIPQQHSQWRVARAGELFRGPYGTKDEAVRAAQLLALLYEPAQVLIHDATQSWTDPSLRDQSTLDV